MQNSSPSNWVHTICYTLCINIVSDALSDTCCSKIYRAPDRESRSQWIAAMFKRDVGEFEYRRLKLFQSGFSRFALFSPSNVSIISEQIDCNQFKTICHLSPTSKFPKNAKNRFFELKNSDGFLFNAFWSQTVSSNSLESLSRTLNSVWKAFWWMANEIFWMKNHQFWMRRKTMMVKSLDWSLFSGECKKGDLKSLLVKDLPVNDEPAYTRQWRVSTGLQWLETLPQGYARQHLARWRLAAIRVHGQANRTLRTMLSSDSESRRWKVDKIDLWRSRIFMITTATMNGAFQR